MEFYNQTNNSGETANQDPILKVGSPGGVCYMILQLTFAAAIIVSNFVVVVVIVNTRSLHSTTNALLASISVADFLVGFHRIHSLLFEMELIYAPELCQLAYATSIFLCGTSVLHMYLITVERYVAISDPLHYHSKLTRTRVSLAMACSWIMALLAGSASYLGDGVPPKLLRTYTYCTTAEVLSFEYLLVAFISTFFIPGLSITWMYWRIFRIVKQHRRLISEMAIPNIHAQQTAKTMTKDLKAVRLLSLLLASFIISWIPYFMDSFYTQFHPYNKVVYCTTVTLSFGKSLGNPFLYAVGKREVRHGIVRFICCNRRNTFQDSRASRMQVQNGSSGNDQSQSGSRQSVSTAAWRPL